MTLASEEWTGIACDMLVRAGFELKHVSATGSRYFHLPGRSGGTLRVAAHSMEKGVNVAARLTIHAGCWPKNEQKLEQLVAAAVGNYMLRTERAGGDPELPALVVDLLNAGRKVAL